jgi:hypothetical protein
MTPEEKVNHANALRRALYQRSPEARAHRLAVNRRSAEKRAAEKRAAGLLPFAGRRRNSNSDIFIAKPAVAAPVAPLTPEEIKSARVRKITPREFEPRLRRSFPCDDCSALLNAEEFGKHRKAEIERRIQRLRENPPQTRAEIIDALGRGPAEIPQETPYHGRTRGSP